MLPLSPSFSSYSFSSCDFSPVMLPLSSSFSSCSFLMNTLIFYSASALFFLHISTLCLYPFWKSLSLSNSSYNIAFFFSPIANIFFRLLTSRVKFPIFKLTIAMVWNNSTTLFAYITFATISSITFGVLVCVVGFLDRLKMIPSPTPFCSPTHIQMEIPL